MKKLMALFCICGFFCLKAASLQAQVGNAPFPGLGWSQGSFDDAFAEMERAFAEMDLDTEPTPRDLYFLGRSVAASILSIYPPYTGNPELTHYLNLICQALLVNSPEIVLFDGASVFILDSLELNALTSPGGHIFITRGLVQASNSEDMLAAIIAHELAHIKLEHAASVLRAQVFFDDMAAIRHRAFEFSRDSPAAQSLMGFRDSLVVMIDTILRNGYSQVQELEADREALVILQRAGYNPRALIEVLELFQVTPWAIQINTTHPSPAERIANIERLLGGRQFPDTSSYRMHRFRN